MILQLPRYAEPGLPLPIAGNHAHAQQQTPPQVAPLNRAQSYPVTGALALPVSNRHRQNRDLDTPTPPQVALLNRAQSYPNTDDLAPPVAKRHRNDEEIVAPTSAVTPQYLPRPVQLQSHPHLHMPPPEALLPGVTPPCLPMATISTARLSTAVTPIPPTGTTAHTTPLRLRNRVHVKDMDTSPCDNCPLEDMDTSPCDNNCPHEGAPDSPTLASRRFSDLPP
jgi:hypothetical protein